MNIKLIKSVCNYSMICIILAFSSMLAEAKTTKTATYKNDKTCIELRIKDLLRRMTIEEKAGQLNQLNGGQFTGPQLNNDGQQQKMQQVREGRVGSFLNVIGAEDTRAIQKVAVEESRLGIPLLFAYDVIHGYKTLFPIPLAEACSWNVEQVEKNAQISALETASAGIHWTFAPMCDISTDPRWGRVMEGAGEDPYLAGVMSAARVRGLQGDLTSERNVLACVKHFAGYGAVEAGVDYNYVDFSRTALFNKHLPPYKAAIEEGAASVMNSFTVYDGIPTSGNKYLITDILKNMWGFKGFLVSDWASFSEMVDHGYAIDRKDAAYKAITAGSMIDMESRTVIDFLPELVKEGKISMSEIDIAVGRILYYKFKLGLFEDPYRYANPEKEKANIFTEKHRKIAREAAQRSIILLQNNDEILPLSQNPGNIALIGLYAKNHDDLFDRWSAKAESENGITIFQGLESRLGKISYSDGYKADGSTTDSLINEALKTVRNTDIILVGIGLSGRLAGEDQSLSDVNIPQGQIELLKALQKTGKPIVALVRSGRPLILTQIKDMASSILYVWHLGTEEGNAVADVLFGDYNPSAKTVMSFPVSQGQIPVYYNRFSSGRPSGIKTGGSYFTRFRDIPMEPLYPFGFGLSYTNFEYSDLTLSSDQMDKNGQITVSVKVKNNGEYAGTEIVQLYIQDIAASIVRPIKELKKFERIVLLPAEEKQVSFTLMTKDLLFYNEKGEKIIEAGKFNVFIGTNSKETQKASFDLK